MDRDGHRYHFKCWCAKMDALIERTTALAKTHQAVMDELRITFAETQSLTQELRKGGRPPADPVYFLVTRSPAATASPA
jgi:hypothetical protein